MTQETWIKPTLSGSPPRLLKLRDSAPGIKGLHPRRGAAVLHELRALRPRPPERPGRPQEAPARRATLGPRRHPRPPARRPAHGRRLGPLGPSPPVRAGHPRPVAEPERAARHGPRPARKHRGDGAPVGRPCPLGTEGRPAPGVVVPASSERPRTRVSQEVKREPSRPDARSPGPRPSDAAPESARRRRDRAAAAPEGIVGSPVPPRAHAGPARRRGSGPGGPPRTTQGCLRPRPGPSRPRAVGEGKRRPRDRVSPVTIAPEAPGPRERSGRVRFRRTRPNEDRGRRRPALPPAPVLGSHGRGGVSDGRGVAERPLGGGEALVPGPYGPKVPLSPTLEMVTVDPPLPPLGSIRPERHT